MSLTESENLENLVYFLFLIFGLLTLTNINNARLDSCELLLVIVTEILKKRLTLGIRITDLRTSPKFER